jgi:hypothetical protein
MELKDLNAEERLALVALSRAIVRADGAISTKENEMLASIAAEIGQDVYREAHSQAVLRFADKGSLRTFLGKISRPEARELISDTILELATGDALAPEEVDFMRWLDEIWRPAPEPEEPGPG